MRKFFRLISVLILCLTPPLLTPALSAQEVPLWRQGDEISLPEAGWYFNLSEERVTAMIRQARRDNNRVSILEGYYVHDVGPRFIIHILDQPSRLLGANPNWVRWNARTGLTAGQLRARYHDHVNERGFAGWVDSYSTPDGIRYTALFRRHQRDMRRTYPDDALDIGVPASQWPGVYQRRMQEGRLMHRVATAINQYGEVEFTAIFNQPREHIRHMDAFVRPPREIMQRSRDATRNGLSILAVDVLPDRGRDGVRYSVQSYEPAGHAWDISTTGRGARSVLLDIPRHRLQERLEQIRQAGRRIWHVDAAQRYHGGGRGNDVVFAMILVGNQPLPNLPPAPVAEITDWEETEGLLNVADNSVKPGETFTPPPPPLPPPVIPVQEAIQTPEVILPEVKPGAFGDQTPVVELSTTATVYVSIRDAVSAVTQWLGFSSSNTGAGDGPSHLESMHGIMGQPGLFSSYYGFQMTPQRIGPSGIVRGSNIGGGLVG